MNSKGIPSTKQLWEARDHFAELLQEYDTRELMWQHLFTECPYILSMSLPLKLLPQDIQPLGRPGRSEPDFIFYPQHNPETHQSYGVIELKTPQSTILTTTRKNLITLSRSASTAVAQARRYLRHLESRILVERRDDVLFVGNNLHVFIIMGLTQELRKKLIVEMLHDDLRSLLPDNFLILPYDQLYHLFEASVPPRIMACVVPVLSETNKQDIPSDFTVCPKCHSPMHETTIDNWYYEGTGTSDSDGPWPRYEYHYECSKCGYEVIDT